jgi:hypothetical protein
MTKTENLHREIHETLDWADAHMIQPHLWPLSREEQAEFIRGILNRIHKIVQSKEYALEALDLKLEEAKTCLTLPLP